jgi:hypothetical protein
MMRWAGPAVSTGAYRARASQALILIAASAASSCVPLTHDTRAAASSLGCMHVALSSREVNRKDDALAHCVAAGMIARHCSATEAVMASIGKELQDLFGTGNAEWRDLGSDRRGIRCAKTSASDTELERCCRGQ